MTARDAYERASAHMHFMLREAVTGAGEKRVRDYLKEKRMEPIVIRSLDKIAFTFGVINLMATEAILLVKPSDFKWWYTINMCVLIMMRVPYYVLKKMKYFLFDFCYFCQIFTILSVWVWPDSCRLFKMAFLFNIGPLAWACLVWGNKYVFHDLDKVSSLFLHLLPGLMSVCQRWHMTTGVDGVGSECTGMDLVDLGNALKGYVGWQALYLLKTEMLDKQKLDADPSMHTSLRWMMKDQRSAAYKMILSMCRKLRVMTSEEVFEPSVLKTKVIFVIAQLIYTCMCFMPVPLLFLHVGLCCAFLGTIFLIAVYRGGTWYIEVFSRRYWDNVESKSPANRKLSPANRKFS
ncbi:unnamed protein product [Chrysoparadoxa australica]